MKRIIALLFIAFFITGCTGLGGKSNAETAQVPHTGVKGVTLSFVQNAPPSTIYFQPSVSSQIPYQIVVNVKNEGAYSYPSLQLYLLGFDPNIFTNLDTSANSISNLEGRSAQNPIGGITQFTKDIGSINLPSGTDTLSFNLLVAACYNYETDASLPVCIDPDPYGVVAAKACIPHGATAGGGQGAPIAITSVQQESLPNKAIFKITVSNSGGGQAYQYPPLTSCMNLKYSEVDRINYESITIGTNIYSECSPQSPVMLTNGKATITCIFDIPSTQNQAFTSSLNIKLKYGYMNTIQKPVTVKRI